MASPTLTVGDTYPPIRGAAKDGGGLMELSEADALTFVAVGTTATIEGEAKAIDPAEDGFNWSYTLDSGDTATPGTYTPWLKIIWDAQSDPKRIEWVKAGDQILIQEAPE